MAWIIILAVLVFLGLGVAFWALRGMQVYERDLRIRITEYEKRIASLETRLADMDISDDTAQDTLRKIKQFSDGVAAIMAYDGNRGGKR